MKYVFGSLFSRGSLAKGGGAARSRSAAGVARVANPSCCQPTPHDFHSLNSAIPVLTTSARRAHLPWSTPTACRQPTPQTDGDTTRQ